LRVDVRLIAASNRDIIEAIRQGQFREDLYHRLNVVQFRPPPLRERGGDVRLLADHFLKQFNVMLNKSIGAVTPAALRLLQEHHWPGNVRELRNVMERAVILETGAEIRPTSLPDFHLETGLRKAGQPTGGAPSPAAGVSLEEAVLQYERELVLRTLGQHHYNLAKTADQLKITRHALRYRINRLNINLESEPEDPEVAPDRPGTAT
jgi:DNA-binding NtrC family response regulator